MHVCHNKFILDQGRNSIDVNFDVPNNNSNYSDNGGMAMKVPLTRRIQHVIADY